MRGKAKKRSQPRRGRENKQWSSNWARKGGRTTLKIMKLTVPDDKGSASGCSSIDRRASGSRPRRWLRDERREGVVGEERRSSFEGEEGEEGEEGAGPGGGGARAEARAEARLEGRPGWPRAAAALSFFCDAPRRCLRLVEADMGAFP